MALLSRAVLAAQLRRVVACLYTSPRRLFDVKDEDDFKKRVLESTKPVVVDFHADWCNPCRILGPRLTECLQDYNGAIELAKVNVDDLPDLAMEYGASSIPLVIGMRDGKVVDQFVGAQDVVKIKEFLSKVEK
ncbi:thioredoxin, mitochondrial-like [Corticium candelabrum]|uniref:thioredoxin, mitochondrial-like n=1 Tax=Corticium candelabrum TaxID=121492 RepID=UPI002E265D3C|nr:thioredoxin, mitochondrial-like [Corticium candelabrum]